MSENQAPPPEEQQEETEVPQEPQAATSQGFQTRTSEEFQTEAPEEPETVLIHSSPIPFSSVPSEPGFLYPSPPASSSPPEEPEDFSTPPPILPPPPEHVILAPLPPPPEFPPQQTPELQEQQRKSVTWSISSSDSSDSDGRDSNSPLKDSRRPRPARSIPKIQRSKRHTLSPRTSNSWLKTKFNLFSCCSGGPGDSDSDDVQVYDDFKLSKLKGLSEEEIVGRLQHAVHELCQRPTNYDIDAEILKWHRTLEIEQKLYEESGRPKFKYKWFRKNQYLTTKKHPLYGTNYENHRKLEVRLEEFRFGAYTADDSLGPPDVKYGHRNTYESKDSTYWRNNAQISYANLAFLCSASNFFRFPQACYANGGFTFLLTYCLMIATVGQPLLYFEMILGQLSLHGPSGFARLHPYAKGLPYAIAYVCIVFGSSRSVYLAYSILYSLISLVASPGKCGWWKSDEDKCVPYESFEMHEKLLKDERSKAEMAKQNDTVPQDRVHIFSVELFFREVMLDAEWRSGSGSAFFHWKLVLAYILVCGFALVPVHYNLGGKSMKKYLRHSSMVIPVMIGIVFLHQIFARGAMSLATEYFLSVDKENVSALSIWSEAFEMVLSTLGIGYGFHWSISGNISLDYRETYRMSWKICGFAVLFGLLSSLVLFCEIGIVGVFTGDLSHYHVFYERLGISFVCYSGALYKLGSNSVVLIFIFFLLFVVYGMWSQIIVIDIILRWIEHKHIIKGHKNPLAHRKRSTIAILVALQLFVISPYYFSSGGSVLASENIFGGALAAYLVVSAELVTAGYLYGFPRFLADLEIMIKRPSSGLFMFQIRYIALPTILIFMLPMIVNVYFYPSIYRERNQLGWLFYLGLALNFAPIIILIICLPFDIPIPSKFQNKVAPHYNYYHPPSFVTAPPTSAGTPTMEKIRKRYPFIEPKFVSKEDCPSQQSHGLTIRSEIYQVVEHNMEIVHGSQDYVKTQFIKLLRFKIVQRRWLKLLLGVMITSNIKINSMYGLVSRIMFAQRCRNDRIDIKFLNQALEQIVNLTFSTAVRKLQRMPLPEMLLYMTDELLKLTTFHIEDRTPPKNVLPVSSSSSSSSSSSGSSDADGTTKNKTSSSSSSSSTQGQDIDNKPKKEYLQIHRRLIGQIEKCPEEMRTLLTIRLKRGLNLPYGSEISVLKFLRRQRAKQEREQSCWTQRDKVPIDHFIPSSISNRKKEKICFTIFHAVVLEGSDHFALKKLPVPKPAIVRVTKAFIQSQPGNTLTEKFADIVTKRMHRNVKRILEKRNLKDMSKNKLKRHLWRVQDRVDDDVYDFLDRILTCVIVIVPDSEAKKTLKKTMYLTPRTRRRAVLVHEGSRRRALTLTDVTDYDITSYATLTFQQRQQEYWEKLLESEQPPDIKYHSDTSSESEESLDEDLNFVFDAKSSSGSSSTLSSEEIETSEATSAKSSVTTSNSVGDIASMVTQTKESKSQYLLTNETLQSRDKRLLKKKSGFGVHGMEETEEDVAVCLSATKIRHISARRWKHERDIQQKNDGTLRYTDKEIKLQRNVEAQASQVAIQAVQSKSMEALKLKRSKSRVKEGGGSKGGLKKAVSLESIRHLLESQAEFKVDMSKGQIVAISKDKMDSTRLEGKLKNTDEELFYIAYGKTLIVDRGVKLSSTSFSKHRQRSDIGQRSVYQA